MDGQGHGMGENGQEYAWWGAGGVEGQGGWKVKSIYGWGHEARSALIPPARPSFEPAEGRQKKLVYIMSIQ